MPINERRIAEPEHWDEVKCDECGQTIAFEVSCGDINCTTWLCPKCAEKRR